MIHIERPARPEWFSSREAKELFHRARVFHESHGALQRQSTFDFKVVRVHLAT